MGGEPLRELRRLLLVDAGELAAWPGKGPEVGDGKFEWGRLGPAGMEGRESGDDVPRVLGGGALLLLVSSEVEERGLRWRAGPGLSWLALSSKRHCLSGSRVVALLPGWAGPGPGGSVVGQARGRRGGWGSQINGGVRRVTDGGQSDKWGRAKGDGRGAVR